MSEKQYSDPIYDLDGKISVSKAIPFGLQHILAMFVANIAPILIVASVVKMPVEQSGALVQSAMLVAGIGIGFTQTPAIFKIFPDLIKNVFAENCVAVVFIVAMVLNIILPKEEEE